MNEYTAVSMTGSTDPLVPNGNFTRGYDENGNLVDTDTTGTLPNSQRRKFSYDAFNRLVEITDGWDQSLVTYAYDHRGRRVQKVVSSILAGLTETYTYFYLGNKLIEERKKTPLVDETRQYVWGGGALLQYTDGLGAYYVHENGYGSVMATTTAGASPAVEDRFDYDAYGQVKRLGVGSTSLALRFRSMYYDAEIALYSISDGAYNPALGSYLSRVFASPGFSLYAHPNLLTFAPWWWWTDPAPIPADPELPWPPEEPSEERPCSAGIRISAKFYTDKANTRWLDKPKQRWLKAINWWVDRINDNCHNIRVTGVDVLPDDVAKFTPRTGEAVAGFGTDGWPTASKNASDPAWVIGFQTLQGRLGADSDL